MKGDRTTVATKVKTRPRALVIHLLVGFVGLAGATGGPESSKGQPNQLAPVKKDFTTESFAVSGKQVAVDVFEPKTKGQHPAVILLHDSAGLRGPAEKIFQQCGRTLAAEGYVAFLVHYFETTGHRKVEPADVTPKVFHQWMVAVRGTVTFARGRKNVDGRRIGLVGFSIGGYLAMAAASEKDLGIAAVAEFFGGLPEPLWKDLRHLPPTLIIHGDQDGIIPVKEAYALWGYCLAKKVPHVVRIYPGQQHLFKGNIQGLAALDARVCALRFLKDHLMDAGVKAKK
jgi:carboxymethylenebutenolidase